MEAAYRQLEPELMANFSEKFRTSDDYSIQFVRYYQIILGHVDVRSMYFGQTANTDNPEKTEQLLFEHKKVKITNVNDTIDATDRDLQKIISLFKRRFPKTSSFERAGE